MRVTISPRFREYLKSYDYDQVVLTQGIGESGFFASEFVAPMTIKGLLKELGKIDIKVYEGKDDIQKLNSVLNSQRLYETFPGIRWGKKVKDLISHEFKLSRGEHMLLNRLIMEKVYPEKCPKRQWMSYPAKCLFMFSKDQWEHMKTTFDKYFGNEKSVAKKFMEMFNKNTVTLDLEKAQYIEIPKYLLKRAGIKQDVVVLGKEDRIEIWAKNKRRPILNDSWVLLSN